MNKISGWKPKVLLVEDEPLIQKIHRLMLEKIGCEVELAGSGSEALNKIANHYDIIFMDIGLPDINGFEVTREFRQHELINAHKPTPIIALTAYCLHEVRDKCEAVGINKIATKPIKIDEL